MAPRAKRIGIALLMVAVLTLTLSVAMTVRSIGPPVWRAVTGPTALTPLDQTLPLRAGRYVVFERTGRQSGGAISVTRNDAVTIAPGQVQVVGPNGVPVATTRVSSRQTISRNGRIFTGAVTFRAAKSGRFQIRIRTAVPREVIITQDIGQTILSALSWLIAGFASFLTLIAAIVVLVRGPRVPRTDH